MKGRVATEICTSDETELMLCELIFANIFKNLDADQCSALLSCLVTQEKSPDNWDPKEEYKEPLQLIYEVDKKIQAIEKESGLERDEVERVCPAMLDITHMWMKGSKFSE